MKQLLVTIFTLFFMTFLGQETEPKNEENKEKINFTMKEKGFFYEPVIGINLGNDIYGYNTAGFALATTAGYQHRNLGFGLGVGAENWVETFAFPVYSSFRYYLSRKGTAPFIALNGGYTFGPTGSSRGDYLLPYYYYPAFVNGWMGSLHFGVRRALGSKFAMVVSTGARYQRTGQQYYDSYLEQNVKRVSEYYRFEVRLGVYFN